MPDAPVDPTDRVRTPLLALITREALDQDYQVVASRRAPARGEADAGSPPSGARAGTGVLAVLLAFGLLVTIAAVQTSRNADVEDASRASLIGRIEARREQVQNLQQRISDLRDVNAEAEDDLVALGDDLNAVQSDVTDLEVMTGFVAVRGGGVRVVLDNDPLADPETEYIRDSDLVLLVDGLWQAGAEAISINGQRLTAKSAIRISGQAIEVNSVGIAPPYTVLAIGDTDSLAADFLDSASGLAFNALATQFGFSYDIDNVDDIRMAAAPQDLRQLRFARQLTEGPRTPGGESTP